ncbi:hypothetical protein [Enterococcus cecorum]|uniref:hypothetical protein n=1 Tax=Enterococcus cecorum TaxID=44008 RepID=UPI002ACA276B|nr:hypothetical protein [Enterococcus cecorum]MDZ5548479.1 hypothetical protein [Enterococcus cecorum]MDZ5594431.1 hypothetical protein [Enterococcus cecorum]
MIKGKTKSGFKFELDEEVLNDYEIIELLGDVEENPLLFPKVVKRILGDEQTTALKNHVRDENGRVNADKMTAEVTEIFESQNQLKK